MNDSIPAVPPPKRLRLPPHAEERLRTGVRVLAIRKPIVGRVELRLRVPAGRAQDPAAGGARAMLLADALLTGTDTHTARQIAERLQALGATLDASCGSDDLIVSGGVLEPNLPALLDLIAEVLAGPAFPGREVAIAADRLAQKIDIRRSRAEFASGEQALRRAFGAHRYGRLQPDPARVRAMRGPVLKAHSGAHLAPKGSTLILVGDLHPGRAVETVASALSGWRARPAPAYEARTAPAPNRRPLLVDRPGSVQTSIRMVMPAVDRRDDAYPALLLAETVLAGYFTSRLVRNIRETRGYCYSCGSHIDVRRLASMVHLLAPVGAEVTAPALREIRYEMIRMATETVEAPELDAAKRYLAGAALLSMQTQHVLADAADALLAEGCDLSYLETFAPKIHAVTADEVLAASQRFLTPARAATVLVGDAATVGPALEPTDDVEIAPAKQ